MTDCLWQTDYTSTLHTQYSHNRDSSFYYCELTGHVTKKAIVSIRQPTDKQTGNEIDNPLVIYVIASDWITEFCNCAVRYFASWIFQQYGNSECNNLVHIISTSALLTVAGSCSRLTIHIHLALRAVVSYSTPAPGAGAL